MRRQKIFLMLNRVASVLFCCTVGIWPYAGGAMRSVSVADGIVMTHVADRTYPDGPSCDHIASFSPDRKKFIVVLENGNLRNDINQYRILLWKTRSIGSEQPKTILRMSSSSIRPAIDPRTISWASDGQSFTFLGEHRSGHHEVFDFNLRTHELRMLTHRRTSIMAYSIDGNRDEMVFTAIPPFRSLWNLATARNGLAVTTQKIEDLVIGRIGYGERRTAERDLFVKSALGTRSINPLPGREFVGLAVPGEGSRYLSISPNGRYAVAVETVPYARIPEEWHRYPGPEIQHIFSYIDRLPGPPPASDDFSQYVLVDLRSGESHVLLNSPVIFPNPVIWAPDSLGVIISDTPIPEDRYNFEFRHRKSFTRATVEINLRNRKVTPLGSSCYQALSWRQNLVTCRARWGHVKIEGGSIRKTKHRKLNERGATECLRERKAQFTDNHGKWKRKGPVAVVGGSIEVYLRESMNSPAKLYWRVPGHRGHLLYNLNPQFRDVKFGRVKLITWKWGGHHVDREKVVPKIGKKITAELYYPPKYIPGRRYPLVIQTHGWNKKRFEIDGPWTTAYAAQPLAARNIFVLQLQDEYLPVLYKEHAQLREVARAVEIYRSAIKYLSDRGIIDPRKVGVMGFSHTCLYVKWALVHDPELFAAATVAEGGDGGYLQYITHQWGYIVDIPSLYGGGPFGRNLKTWMRLSPSFNLNRVQTPLWINVLNPHYVLLDWEWFEGLRALHKPVEMVMLDGRQREQHFLETPWDRRISEGGNVDWFDFWLNGHEAAHPAMAGEYARWEKLCRMQRRQHPRREAFCVLPTSRAQVRTERGETTRSDTG